MAHPSPHRIRPSLGRRLAPLLALAFLAAATATMICPRPAQAIPPLSEPQKTQLQTANDESFLIDEAALYPLLKNAMRWVQGDEAGAAVPDYKALFERPAEQRGELMLIEGLLAEARPNIELSRPGPWSETLEPWFIQVRNDPALAVVVYLTNPPTGENRPRKAQGVRLPARFFKVWHARNQDDQKLNRFLVFVGRGITQQPPPGIQLEGRGGAATAADNGSGSGVEGGLAVMLGALVLIIGVYFFVVRRLFGKQTSKASEVYAERRRLRQQRNQEATRKDQAGDGSSNGQDESETSQEELPKDPAAALGQLQRRQVDEKVIEDS